MDKKERYLRYKYSQGLDSWHIASYKEPELQLTLNDGPCGVRKPACDEFTNQSGILVATCVPNPCSIAASFDKDVALEVGKVLASDCKSKNVNVLLAPGVNIKRSVLCGRNFEYFSEDPILAGSLAGNYIKGLETSGVSSCLKHYCANNKEWARRVCSSEVALRPLNEIYLRSFTEVFDTYMPSSVMTSYNKVNGEYSGESEYLITKKLRGEFGFKGIIMSDWNAVSNKGKTIHVGQHVQMPLTPRSGESIDKELEAGYFSEDDLIARDNELHEGIKKILAMDNGDKAYDFDKAHSKCVELASETSVLVKNDDNYLPLKKEDKVLFIGEFIRHNYFVAGGSAWVNAYGKENFMDILFKNDINFQYIEGIYKNVFKLTENDLLQCKDKVDKVVLFLGQNFGDESEGSDRAFFEIHEEQRKLIELVKKVYKDFAVVFTTGSVCNIKDIYNDSKACLIQYLAGEGQAEAIYNNLYGIHNPCGRLPETWISSLDQHPLYKHFLTRNSYFEYYDEDIYVGYRYYLDHHDGFMLPFGYGLSYTTFVKTLEEVSLIGDEIVAKIKVSNIGKNSGATVIELFTSKDDSAVYRPTREFKAFSKVFLNAGETKLVEIKFPVKKLSVYEDASDSMKVEQGKYMVYLCENAFEVLGEGKEINVNGEVLARKSEQSKLSRKHMPGLFTVDMTGHAYIRQGVALLKEFTATKPNINYPALLDWLFRNNGAPLRDLIEDRDINMSFDDCEDMAAFYNKNKTKPINNYESF